MMLSFYVPALMVAIANGLLSPVLPLFIKDLGGSYGGVGLVLAAPLLGTLIGDIPGGVLLRRWGHRQAMVIGFAAHRLDDGFMLLGDIHWHCIYFAVDIGLWQCPVCRREAHICNGYGQSR